jgi:hypothetical protein
MTLNGAMRDDQEALSTRTGLLFGLEDLSGRQILLTMECFNANDTRVVYPVDRMVGGANNGNQCTSSCACESSKLHQMP